jgi:hypothetical protein
VVWRDGEGVEHLADEDAVLRGQADARLDTAPLELKDDRGELDGLGSGADDDEDDYAAAP